MRVSLFLARRYIKNNRDSRFLSLLSIITIIGIALGTASLILALTILDGFQKVISEKIVEFNSHIQINSYGMQKLPDYQNITRKIDSVLAPYASGVSPFASRLSIIKSKHTADGVILKGLLKEYDISDIDKYIVEGSFNIEYIKDSSQITIGKKLAERLRLKVGDRVVIFTLRNNEMPSFENPPGIKNFYVSGIFESSMAEYDDAFAYTNLKTAQELFGLDDNVTGYDIKLNNLDKTDSLASSLSSFLKYPYYVRTIFQLHQNIFSWIELQKKPIPLALGLIVIVAVFNIVSALLMIVLEKLKTIGILKSLGANRKTIAIVFALQGIYLAFIGVVLGNLIAFILSYLQLEFNLFKLPATIYYITSAPIDISAVNYLLVSILTFLLSIIASIAPSAIAARANILELTRFN